MITLFIGDVTRYLSDIALSHDPTAKLITDENFESLSPGTYYSSLGDISGLKNFGKLLQQADKIIYAPPPKNQWSGGNRMEYWTEEYLKAFSCKVEIENYEAPLRVKNMAEVLSLSDTRKTNNQQIWVAGCSNSHGSAVKPSERYGQLLSDKLTMPVSFLTEPGSSITWAADQILRSDIRKNDIVIWGLTSGYRVPRFIEDTLHHVYANWFEKHPEHAKTVMPIVCDDLNTLYHNLISIYQVVNFCKLAKARLVIAPLLPSDEMYFIKDLPNFLMLTNLWGRDRLELYIDLGTDNAHPGPLTHKFFADKIYEKLISE